MRNSRRLGFAIRGPKIMQHFSLNQLGSKKKNSRSNKGNGNMWLIKYCKAPVALQARKNRCYKQKELMSNSLILMVYQVKNAWFPLRLTLLQWWRLMISSAHQSESLILELSWAWEPPYSEGAWRLHPSKRSYCCVFSWDMDKWYKARSSVM